MKNDLYYISGEEINNAQKMYDNKYLNSQLNAENLNNELTNYIEDSKKQLTGAVWDGVRDNLALYSSCMNKQCTLSGQIRTMSDECLQEVLEFLGSDVDLNTNDLPKYEKNRDSLLNNIEELNKKNEEFAKVPSTVSVYVGRTEEGKEIYKNVHNPEYDKAQNDIKENNNLIKYKLTPELNETKRLIEKINCFNSVILPSIQRKCLEMENEISLFANDVDNLPQYDNHSINTFIVGATGALSSFGKVVESVVVDGLVWLINRQTVNNNELYSSLIKLTGNEDENIFDRMNEDIKNSTMDFIAVDNIQNWNDSFYKSTNLGKDINNKSNIKYDNNPVEKNLDNFMPQIVEGAASFIPVYGTAVATAIGSLNQIGKTAQEAYQNSRDFDAPTKDILVNGVRGAAEGYAMSEFMGSLPNALKDGLKPVKIPNKDEITAIIRSLSKETVKDTVINTISKSAKDAVMSPGNALQVVATTLEDINEGNFTPQSVFKNVYGEYGLDILHNSLGEHVAAGWNVVDGLADAGITEQIDEHDA